MNLLSLLEILVVVSATLQIGAIICYVFLRSKITKEERKVWTWFMWPLVLILIRRLLATARYSYSFPTLELEYVITIGVTICWIIFLYKFISKKIVRESINNEPKDRRSSSCSTK